VTVEGEEVTVYSTREREPVPLSILHHPLCITISYYDAGQILLLDATWAEEQVRDGQVIITMNRHGELCQIAKYGGVPVDALAILNWTKIALGKVQILSEYIKGKLDEDARRRDVGGLIAELRAENDR
jgi:exosome complex component RRP45